MASLEPVEVSRVHPCCRHRWGRRTALRVWRSRQVPLRALVGTGPILEGNRWHPDRHAARQSGTVWIQRDGLRENANVWDRCAPVDAGARRCERGTVTPRGRFDVVASADGRVVYLAFAPATRDIIFDDSLTWMQRPWTRTRGVRLDPHGVSDENPYGVAEMRWPLAGIQYLRRQAVREHASPPPLPQFYPARRLARRPTVRGHVRAAVKRSEGSASQSQPCKLRVIIGATT